MFFVGPFLRRFVKASSWLVEGTKYHVLAHEREKHSSSLTKSGEKSSALEDEAAIVPFE